MLYYRVVFSEMSSDLVKSLALWLCCVCPTGRFFTIRINQYTSNGKYLSQFFAEVSPSRWRWRPSRTIWIIMKIPKSLSLKQKFKIETRYSRLSILSSTERNSLCCVKVWERLETSSLPTHRTAGLLGTSLALRPGLDKRFLVLRRPSCLSPVNRESYCLCLLYLLSVCALEKFGRANFSELYFYVLVRSGILFFLSQLQKNVLCCLFF